MAELLAFINDYHSNNACCPSYDEMMVSLGLRSKGRISRLIDALEERGHIRRLPGKVRAIEVVDQTNLPRELEQRIAAHCRKQGISRASFDVLCAEQYLRSVA
jgi:SOS-response transcriptional repressor LexA